MKGEKNLISRVTTLLDSNVQFSTKTQKAYKETGRYGQFKGKKKMNRDRPKKELMADLLDSLENNCLRDAQRIKVRCGKCQENNV